VFIPAVIIIAVALAACIAIGARRWRHPLGKTAVVIGGLLLVALAAYTLLVLLLAESARRGAPL